MTAIKGEGNNISEIDNTEHIRNIVSPQYILNPCYETETRKENVAKGVTNTRIKKTGKKMKLSLIEYEHKISIAKLLIKYQRQIHNINHMTV